MSTDFADLLQDVEQMSAITDKENAGLPRLQRTLSQLFEVNKRKLAKTSNYLSSDTNEINASILLAGRGIDAPKLAQTIENLSIQHIAMAQQQQASQAQAPHVTHHDTSSFSPFDKFSSMEQLRDVDLQTFLKSEKENALMAIIEETREKTMQEIDDLFTSSNESEWERQKQKIMNELLGSFGSSTGSDMGSKTATSTLNTSLSSTTQSSRTVMSDIEMEFSKQVFIYNQKQIENQQPQPDLLECFRNLAARLNDKNIEEAWKILGFMSRQSTQQVTRCRDFGDNEQYMDRDGSNEAQLGFINQALGYLEHSYKELIQSKVNANLKQAKLGGQLGTNALVNAYLRLSISEKFHQLSVEKFEDREKGQQQLLWPSIYLSLRCGDVEAAHAIAVKAKKDDIANYLEEILKDSKSGRLPSRGHLISSSENKLRMEYKSRIKRDNDDYKRVVYCYLCRYGGDDELVNKVLDNVDDFIWFKLNSIDNSRGGPGADGALTFTEFQTKLSVDFGEKYFVTNRNPFTYLQVLLLTAQFEQAIEFMLKFESLVVHGVHMAIGLFEKNLLNVVKSSSATQLFVGGDGPNEPKCFRRINLPCLIKMYTRKFECTDPREALQYYYFLRNLKLTLPGQRRATDGEESERITNYFAQYVCELALETREFDLLFGKLEKNAVRRPGVLDKFARDDQVTSIIALVADEMENKGRVEEAIKLYDLCKQHQRVFELCNKVMSQLVAEVNAPYSDRDRFKNMVVNIAVRYKTETNMTARAIPRSIVSTFYILTDLMTFFDLYHEENWDVAYETVNKLSVLPTTSIAVDSKVKDFIAFSEEIKRNFPELILATMTIISNLYNKFNKSAMGGSMYQNMVMGGSNEKKILLNQLKEHAKALIKFVGCIPYRLSGDINARLLQLEVMMN